MKEHLNKGILSLMIFTIAVTQPPVLFKSAGMGPVIRETAERISRLLGKKTGRDTVEELSKYGGRQSVRKTVERVTQEGGEEAASRLVRLTKNHGAYTLRAMDKADQPAKVLRALDNLPDNTAETVIPRLAGQEGRQLARLTSRHGAEVLKAEAKHPGFGMRLAGKFGDDGAELALATGRRQTVEIARRADEIARLPAGQKERVIDLLKRKTDDMVTFMARFTENNPGKVLFTTAAAGVILANDDKILGTSKIVDDREGNPDVVHKPGLIERTFGTVAKPFEDLFQYVAVALAVGLSGFIGVKLWYARKREKKKTAAS